MWQQPRALPQRLCRDYEAAHYLKSKTLFERLRKAGWIKPVVHEFRLTLYDYADLDVCIERLKAGERLTDDG